MAIQTHVFGAAQVYVGDSTEVELLGYTRDGVEIRLESRFLDVPSDDMGGEAGPPANVQYLGEIAVIRLELTKYDLTVADKLQRLNGLTAGQVGTPGTFIFSDSAQYEKSFRLLIRSAVEENGVPTPWNFPRAFLREAIEVNKGSRFTRLLAVFEAHAKNGILYNDEVPE